MISRVFKDKEANDEFELRDVTTNLPSKEYTNRIGEEIFKINKQRRRFLMPSAVWKLQTKTITNGQLKLKRLAILKM